MKLLLTLQEFLEDCYLSGLERQFTCLYCFVCTRFRIDDGILFGHKIKLILKPFFLHNKFVLLPGGYLEFAQAYKPLQLCR